MYQSIHKKLLVIGVVVVGIATLVVAPRAGAVDWSSEMQLVQSASVLEAPDQCRYQYQSMIVHGQTGRKNVCLDDSASVTFGYYWEGSRVQYVAGSVFDDQLYLFQGCEWIDYCVYSSQADRLFIKHASQYTNSQTVESYGKVSRQLEKVYDGSRGAFIYHLTGSPDYRMESASGTPWYINGWALSSNGRWLAVELRERGLGLVDLQTMKLKRLNQYVYTYGVGRNPTVDMMPSNDGSAVAITGSNAGESIIVNTSECGDYPIDQPLQHNQAIASPCAQLSIPVRASTDSYYQSISPRFNDDSSQLSVYTVSVWGQVTRKSFRTDADSSPQLLYLAMGDSFTSGEGELSDEYYQPHTNDLYEKCHTSRRSYPFLVGAQLYMTDDQIKNVACSGARTVDVAGSDVEYWGQRSRLIDPDWQLTLDQRITAQQQALEEFIPGRIYQNQFVDRYHPRIATLGVGGNDAGLMGKLKTCLMPGTCEWADTAEMIAASAAEIDRVGDRLRTLYRGLRQLSPSTTYYVIGYPQIITSDDHCGVLGWLLDAKERRFIRQSIARLNRIIQSAAHDSGVEYIDVSDVMDRHQLCQDGQAVNGIRLGDDIALLSGLSWLKLVGNESFHPTPYGHQLVAGRLAGILRATAEPASAPDPDESYWGNLQPTQRLIGTIDMTTRSNYRPGDTVSVVVPRGLLLPSTTVAVELHSSVYVPGQYTTSADGSLRLEFQLPLDAQLGFHSLHVTGQSYSGSTSVDIYQTIRIDSDQTAHDPQASLEDADVVSDDQTSDASNPEDQTTGSDAPGSVTSTVPSDGPDVPVPPHSQVTNATNTQVSNSTRTSDLVAQTNAEPQATAETKMSQTQERATGLSSVSTDPAVLAATGSSVRLMTSDARLVWLLVTAGAISGLCVVIVMVIRRRITARSVR